MLTDVLPPDRAEDHRLMDGLAAGSPDILDEIYNHYYPRVESFVCQHSGTPDEARDLFQDLLMAIFYNTQKKDFELTCAFSTYLFSVCRNLWFKELRQRKLEYSRVDTDSLHMDDEEASETRLQWEKYQLYRKCFRQMEETCRQLLRLYMRGSDMKTIARKMGFGSAGYARKRKIMCKEKLVSLIHNDDCFETLGLCE